MNWFKLKKSGWAAQSMLYHLKIFRLTKRLEAIFNIHQSQTKYCWLKIVPFGQRNAVDRPFSSHM